MGDTSSGAAGKTLFSGSQQPCWPLVKNPQSGEGPPTVWPRAAWGLCPGTQASRKRELLFPEN